MKRVISIVVLSIFASSYVLPFLAHENCNRPNCAKNSAHCYTEMANMDCCNSNNGCITVPIHPITVAPINIVDIQKDITIDFTASRTIQFKILTDVSAIELNSDLSPPDIHSGFQTPLLV